MLDNLKGLLLTPGSAAAFLVALVELAVLYGAGSEDSETLQVFLCKQQRVPAKSVKVMQAQIVTRLQGASAPLLRRMAGRQPALLELVDL